LGVAVAAGKISLWLGLGATGCNPFFQDISKGIVNARCPSKKGLSTVIWRYFGYPWFKKAHKNQEDTF
jgi:hypothetical protein